MGKLKPVSFRKPRGHSPRLSKPWVRGVHSPKYWTEAEDQIIKANYLKDFQKCMELLPGRTEGGVHQRAYNRHGFSRNGAGAKWIKAAPEDLDDKLRAAWEKMDGKKRGEVNALADLLKLPRWWLSKRLVILELAIPGRKEPPWTRSEIALMKKVPLHDVARCSKIFREHGFQRTPTAIMVKAKRLDISRRYTATFSATKAGKILGFDSKGITARCISGEIKAAKRKTRRLPQQGGDPWSITRKNLRAFAIEHLEQIDFRKVEKFAFVDLIANTKEPS